MKKFLIIALLASICFEASAQFFTGLSFDVKWSNDGSISSSGVTTKTNNAYSGTISPQCGYILNPKFMVGGRINFIFDKSYSTEPGNDGKDVNYVTSSIGWDIAPFCRYKLMEFGKDGWFSIWADLHTYYGMMYPKSVAESGYITKDFKRKHIYGIQAMPSLGFRINENSTIFVNFAILSLAYSGTNTQYKDYSEYTNKIVLFTGKISGLWTALTSEGMYGLKFGIVRTF